MATTTVHMVMRSDGQYSDAYTLNLRGFLCADKAEAFAQQCRDHQRAYNAKHLECAAQKTTVRTDTVVTIGGRTRVRISEATREQIAHNQALDAQLAAFAVEGPDAAVSLTCEYHVEAIPLDDDR